MTRVTRIIYPTDNNGVAYLETHKGKDAIREADQRQGLSDLPTYPYRVTYALSRKGPYIVFVVGCHVRVLHCWGDSPCAWACFLPRAWHGKRVTRTVRVL